MSGKIRFAFRVPYGKYVTIPEESSNPRYFGKAMKTIHAIYEKGVFRPTEPVDLPEGSPVQIVPESRSASEEEAHLDRVYEILSHRYDGGEPDIAARHNEHQP